MTLEEYLEFDYNAEGRYEYFDGKGFEMSGGGPEHSLLGNKAYKSIESLREYLFVSQDRKFVTLYTKHNQKFWFQSEYVEGETLKLESLECELDVDEIYQGINFES